MLLGQTTTLGDSAVPWAVVGMASSGDRVGVLTAELLNDATTDAHYTLYLHTRGEAVLSRAPMRGSASNVQFLDGILIGRPASFIAVVLWRRGVRDVHRAGLALVEWTADGALLRNQDVVELPSLAESDCPTCSVHASFIHEGDEVVVTVVDGDVLRAVRVDLPSATQTRADEAPLPFSRRRGEPVSASLEVAGRALAAVGGTAAGAPPGEAALIAIDDGSGVTVQEVPGRTNDPPPLVAPGGATLWRFVTDPERAIDSAIHGWELGGASGLAEPAWRIPTAMGFAPTGLEILGGAMGPSIVWSGVDLADAERSELFRVPLEGEAASCEVVQPARVASFPWGLRLIADQPFAAMRDGDDIVVAVLGDAEPTSTLALLRLPSCSP